MKIKNLLVLALVWAVVACEAPQETQTVSQKDSEVIDPDWASFLQLFPTKSLPLAYPDTGIGPKVESTEGRIPLAKVKKYILPHLHSENPLKSDFVSDEKAFEDSYKSVIVYWKSYPITTGFYPEATYQKDGNIFLTIASLQTSGSGDGFGSIHQYYLFAFDPKGKFLDMVELGQSYFFEPFPSYISENNFIKVIRKDSLYSYEFQKDRFQVLKVQRAYKPRGYYQDMQSKEVVIIHIMGMYEYYAKPSATAIALEAQGNEDFTFPNKPSKVYKLSLNFAGDTLTCINPDQSKQFFIRNHEKSKDYEDFFRP
jgi:hypothetical protein